MERAQDVIVHRRLLQMAHSPAARPAIDVRLVQVILGYRPLKKSLTTSTISLEVYLQVSYTCIYAIHVKII